MKNIKIIALILVLLVISLTGCDNMKNTNKDYSAKIDEIVDYLKTIDNTSFSPGDIENKTKSKFQGDIGSGIAILHFKYDEHLSFYVSAIGNTILRCAFDIDNELYKAEAIHEEDD